MKHFVAVAGNIGVGKSTLVGKICARLGWQPYYEPVAENPYLEDFYADMNPGLSIPRYSSSPTACACI